MALERERYWLMLYFLILMTLLVQPCFCDSSQGCVMRPTHTCYITEHMMEMVVSNKSLLACAYHDALFYSTSDMLDCCSADSQALKVVEMDEGSSVIIECFSISTNLTFEYFYTWELNAPEGSQILLTVRDSDISSTIRASEEDNEGEYITYNFFANGLSIFGYTLLSSTNIVSMEAHGSKGSTNADERPADGRQDFVVIAQTITAIETLMVDQGKTSCSLFGPDSEISSDNKWDESIPCQGGTHEFEDSCYQFNNMTNIDISAARGSCEKIGFHLVYIDNSEEQHFLAQKATDIDPKCNHKDDCDFWIGIVVKDGELVWTDGSAITYSNFNDACFRLDRSQNFSWVAHGNCDHKHKGYICEKQKDLTTYATTGCEGGTHEFGDSCYKFDTMTNIDLSSAQESCDEETGFHLVYIDNSEEQNFLAKKATDIRSTCSHNNNCDFWIGIVDEDGELVWTDGSAITYSNFNDACFRLDRSEEYNWVAHGDCNHMYKGYICERERGYHGKNSIHEGCITYTGTPITQVEDEVIHVLVTFSYNIKTFPTTDGMRTRVWKGYAVIHCMNKDQSWHQSGLQLNVSCGAPSRASTFWEVTFQAKGIGLVQISNVKFLLHDKTKPDMPSPVSSTEPFTTSGPESSQYSKAPSVSMVNTPSVPTTIFKSRTSNEAQQPTVSMTTENDEFTTSTPSLSTLSLNTAHLFTPSQTLTTTTPSQATLSQPAPSLPTHTPTPATTHYITTEYSESQDSQLGSGDTIKLVIPIMVILFIVFILVIVAITCYRKRKTAATSSPKPRLQSSDGAFQNPAYESHDGELYDYEDFNDLVKSPLKASVPIRSPDDVLQHIYTDLPTSAPSNENPKLNIYNEVGEQDYHLLFGGREQGHYHEYNLPDTDQVKPKTMLPIHDGSYQELSVDGKRYSPKGTEINGAKYFLPEMTNPDRQKKVPDGQGDHSYQDLRKDDSSYTSLHHGVGSNPTQISKETNPQHENSYQALQADGPEYFTLEPCQTKQPLNQDSIQDNTYQSLLRDETPDYVVLESRETDIPLIQSKPEENTYQPLLKNTNITDEPFKETSQNSTQDHAYDPYDVLQRGILQQEPHSSDGYGTLGQTTKVDEDLDYESPEIQPKTTSDYEDPIQSINKADEPYDHLQRETLPGKSVSTQPQIKQTMDDDVDDYETSNRLADDDTTYQAIEHRQKNVDEDNEEYSKLQRPLGSKPYRDPIDVPEGSNQYGKLNFN